MHMAVAAPLLHATAALDVRYSKMHFVCNANMKLASILKSNQKQWPKRLARAACGRSLLKNLKILRNLSCCLYHVNGKMFSFQLIKFDLAKLEIRSVEHEHSKTHLCHFL